MTFYVYRSEKSEGAAALVKALGGKRIGQGWQDDITLKPGDVVVNWGARIGTVPQGVKLLNNANLLDKFEQIELLQRAKANTVVAKRELDEWIHRNLEHFDGNDLLATEGEQAICERRET